MRKSRGGETLATSIFVRLPSGKQLPASVYHHDPVSKLIQLVADDGHISDNLIRIKHAGKTLNRNSTAGCLGILEGMELKAEIITVKDLQITVKLGDEELSISGLTNIDTVKTVLERVKEKRGGGQITLHYGGQALQDSQVLYDVKVTCNSVIHATITQKPSKRDSSKESLVHHPEQEAEIQQLPVFDCKGKNVEIVFSFDTTGSMYPVLALLREKLSALVERLLTTIPCLRIGLIAHGDYCDQKETYVIKTFDLSSDAEALKGFAMGVKATGGGDAPEAYEWALRRAQQMDWSEDSAKALVVIGDSVPHPPSMTDQNVYWHDELDVLKGMGVKVYGVQARDDSCARPFYKEMADWTNGAYLTLTHFKLIEDMFLAVCYNESSQQDLQEFYIELQAEGHMTAQKQLMFEQLHTQQEAQLKASEHKQRNLSSTFIPRQSKYYTQQPWFDRSLDKLWRRWFYDQTRDYWWDSTDDTLYVVRERLPTTSALPDIRASIQSDKSQLKGAKVNFLKSLCCVSRK